ncbi:type I-G CRISPR-associated RAMP protein Csb1/Cas7g [Actinomyces sp. Z16]|uniref:type I-G CRISPR-associated RAMP protein Csb1/Cas7g n=2 Tax=unclassified Actinomyces TaxID=2609248 RepID=UPI000D593703|nr:type I-U CRISPR-associated RAMP protein Csb1/Cas7u [Actinomyces sp. Z16]RAX23854.1 type I-U CRISPR-associated protein Cas7 [Actinomyces sp. Z3]
MMTTELTLDALRSKLGDPEWAAIRMEATYQPSGGPGTRVYPPTFPIARSAAKDKDRYLRERRRCDGEVREAVVLDQVPAQANRCEEAEARAWRQGAVRMPMLRMRHGGAASFELIGLEAPHRAFDAYWRDCELDGAKFDRTEIGKAILAASLADATALLTYDPATLVYGGWNSHRKGRQAKFPRLYASEIVGWDPEEGKRKAGRMDPANLTGSRSGEGDEWSYSAVKAKKEDAKLSEIGHGNIAPDVAHGGVTISEATRTAVLSLTATRRLGFGSMEPAAVQAARALLVAFGLLGDRLAFGDAGLWLRSGCDLVMQTEQLEWVGRGGVAESFTLSPSAAVQLYEDALQAALDAGVPLHLETVELKPNESLAKAIEFSLTKAESTGE